METTIRLFGLAIYTFKFGSEDVVWAVSVPLECVDSPLGLMDFLHD